MWDLKWTDDFDLEFEITVSSGQMDLLKCRDAEAYAQVITNRIRSVKPDWFYDNVGADLELLLGEPNTRETAQSGADRIRSALTDDGFVKVNDVYIKPVPVDAETIVFFCFVGIRSTNPVPAG